MKAFVKLQVYLAALWSCVPFVKPRDRSLVVLLWPLKLLAGALSPLLGLAGGLGAVLGIARRDWKLAGAGFLGAGLVARYLRDISAAEGQFEAAFGPDRLEQLPAAAPGTVQFQRNVVYGQDPTSGQALLADLWQPPPGAPRTGLGVLYVHGGGWRIGDKDMATRTFFRQLAGQGHLILDIAYTLWPQADIPTMVTQVKQAIVWLKDKAGIHGLDPERIVLMGGSAGGHLALLAAFTPNDPAFQPAPDGGNTSVRGVVAFYPPVDFLTLSAPDGDRASATAGILGKAAGTMMDRLFVLQAEDVAVSFDDFVTALLGGSAAEIPETYHRLSPIYHVGDHCPPTLLVHGSDDVFGLTPGIRRLYRALQAAKVPASLVEFPHTEHGFDLILPQISPVARAATRDVARFLAYLV